MGARIGTKSRARTSGNKSLADEVLAVVLSAAAVVLMISFVTYDPWDPSWNSVGPKQAPSNGIGIVGAYVSDLFFHLFGLASFALPVLLVLIAARLFFSDRLQLPVRKIAGASLLVITLAGLLALFPRLGVYKLQNVVGNGGLVGYFLEGELASLLNLAGAAILLSVVSVLTLMVTMEVSLASIARRLRSTRQVRIEARGGSASMFSRLRAWWALRWEQRRRLARERRAERIELKRRREEERELRRTEELARVEEERRQRAEEVRRWEQQQESSPGAAVAVSHQSAADSPQQSPSEVVAPRRTPVVQRREAAAASGHYAGATEQAAAAHGVAPEITMDPDVAEMVSTASIVRTSLVEKADAASVAGQGAAPRRKPSRALYFGSNFKLPQIDLLETPISHHVQAEEELRERATILAEKCKEFAVTGHIHRINPGPVVTTFEFKPDPGIKYSRVVGLADDLCLALKAESIRIDRIPGKSTVGIEVPNAQRDKILLREVIESQRFQHSTSMLTIGLGKTINGDEYVADLAKMPHLLIAGATGAGKSVTLNAIICSILYKAAPEDVKFIMVDPKRLELGLYEGIPHLLTPIVTDPKRAANALKWAVGEMENRYRVLATLGVRNIEQFNRQVREMLHPTLWDDSTDGLKPLPIIVIAIDELADLMMVARGEVETSIARLAQMARAVGIHLVLATQRPSVDVITGVIKANFPSRIAFRVSSKVDSRTIVDSNGAEALLGQGDMLFLPPASSRLIRVHGSFVNEVEIRRITDHIRKQAEPDYNEQVTLSDQETEDAEGFAGEHDELYDEALAIVTGMGRASTSVLQRRLSIGYGRAAKILDVMEREGFIGPAEGAKPRKVLAAALEFRERVAQRLEDLVD